MALRHGARIRKRWRYVGVFGPELMACVGIAHVGPATTSWWAVWDRGRGVLSERTRFRRAGVDLTPGRAVVRDRGVEIDLELTETDGVETTCDDGGAPTWTRKQAGIGVRGTIRVGGRTHAIDGSLGFIDDSAGFHRRHTSWFWSAGIGSALDGAAVAWNLVSGINDPPSGSERCVWIDGAPREVGPNEFAADLSRVAFAEGGELRFTEEAVRQRDDNLLVVRSTYRQPFGTFSGVLPGGVQVREGYGVMERHVARW